MPAKAGMGCCLWARGEMTKLWPVPLQTGSARGKKAFETLEGCLRANRAFIYLLFDSQCEMNFLSSFFLSDTGRDMH